MTPGAIASTVRAVMTLRATVDRMTSASERDIGGQPVRARRRIHEALPCQYWSRRAGVGFDRDGTKTYVIRESVLMAPVDADLEEGDIIVSLKDRAGRPAPRPAGLGSGGTVRIDRVRPFTGHQELDLEIFAG